MASTEAAAAVSPAGGGGSGDNQNRRHSSDRQPGNNGHVGTRFSDGLSAEEAEHPREGLLRPEAALSSGPLAEDR